MTEDPGKTKQNKTTWSRIYLIVFGLLIAGAIPILPWRLICSPGTPGIPEPSQVATTSTGVAKEIIAVPAQTTAVVDTTSGGTVAPAGKPVISSEAARVAHAEALVKAKQFEQAIVEYKRIVARNPKLALAHHRLGTIFALNDDDRAAVGELEIARHLKPNSAEIANDLGLAYEGLGLTDKATRAFQQALSLGPGFPEAAINLGNIYSAQGNMTDATSVLSRACRLHEQSARLHNNLGCVYSLCGQPARAMHEFALATNLEPAMASAHYGMGLIYMDKHQYSKALKEFQQAQLINPNLPSLANKIDQAYRRAGQSPTDLNPNN